MLLIYQVLYRKWRPKCFSDVYGQPQVTITLKNELMQNRIAHAYLFTGSRGTGKTTCAKILAKAVNCLNPIDGDPCGECEICKGIDSESILDITEIDAASNNSVADIRDLREEVNFTPTMAKYRVYIIDEVHMLTTEAFNALLKTLEEPPAHVIFILATTEVHKLPSTILSRCQRFDFHRISPEDISSRLRYVIEREEGTIDEQSALMIARLADGGMRDALSLLDQCLGIDKNITLDVVTSAAGLTGRDYLYTISLAICNNDCPKVLEIVNELHQNSKDMYRLCDELILHFRNIMLFKTMANPQNLLVFPKDEIDQIESQSKLIPLSNLLYCISSLQDSLAKIKNGANGRVEMEMALIKLTSPELSDSLASLLTRIEKLEDALKSGNFTANNNHTTTATKVLNEPLQEQKEVQIVAPILPTIDQSKATLLDNWVEVLQVLHQLSPSLSAFMNDSKAYVCSEYLLIDAPNSMAFDVLRSKKEQKEKLRNAVFKVTGKSYKLGPYNSEMVQKVSDQVDPLTELAQEAKQAGIEVTVNDD